MALAFGWGAHYRYSWWLERNVISQQPEIQNEEQLRRMLSDTADENKDVKAELTAMREALAEITTKEQQEEITKKTLRYKPMILHGP